MFKILFHSYSTSIDLTDGLIAHYEFEGNANDGCDGIGNNADLDDDNDGISDSDELANGLNPLDPTDADADFDGDGVSNRDEIIAGTNPNMREISMSPILYMLL